ncbi:CIC11C00000005253 [Sungouiella intermedia]|uniref:CIC11C00000005253 n=1 Tax=Sungouiella intermedia TaxID=45354 RepID=A0A1L0BGH1_9ASCO|nr:CIC11C00000005253 [[Candida] intermedia]
MLEDHKNFSTNEQVLLENDSFDAMDLTQVEGNDKVLARKMFLINNALDEIGLTWYHLKLFCIAGLGYSADSQLTLIQSSVKSYVDMQFGRTYPVATEVFYVGLLTGSAFWGFGGDIIGRKTAFNSSLFLASAFGFLTGGMNSYATYCIFMCLSAFCAGGNLALDVTVFLEFSPSRYSWITTFMASWWGVGQTIAVLIAWAFLPSYSCSSSDDCPSSKNRGWRYCWYTNSGIVMFAALLRLFVFKLDETPKFLVSNGRDAEAVEALQKIATKYNRPLSLTLEHLQDCGVVQNTVSTGKTPTLADTWKAIKHHVSILFQSKVMAYSTCLVFLSWTLIGIAYSTFFNFLYIYISLHGGSTGSSPYIVYRNSTISYFVGIFGPMAAAAMVRIPKVGRKGTMCFGGLSGMAILFGYTTVRTQQADVGFASATYFFVNIYFAVLYAYTPEVFPASARTSGGALALVFCRFSSAFAPVVYYFGQKSGSAVPIWVCGACIGALGGIALLLPFEPTNKRYV